MTVLLEACGDKDPVNPGVTAVILVRGIHAVARSIVDHPSPDTVRQELALEMMRLFGTAGLRPHGNPDRARRDGLKPPLVSILEFMDGKGTVTAAELEPRLGASRRSIQRYLQELVEREYVREVATSTTDPTKIYELL